MFINAKRFQLLHVYELRRMHANVLINYTAVYQSNHQDIALWPRKSFRLNVLQMIMTEGKHVGVITSKPFIIMFFICIYIIHFCQFISKMLFVIVYNLKKWRRFSHGSSHKLKLRNTTRTSTNAICRVQHMKRKLDVLWQRGYESFPHEWAPYLINIQYFYIKLL